MFAVPGWSVDSSALKTQTVPKPPPQKPATSSNDAEDEASKKRKRAAWKEVNKNNLADMWEQVIKGKPKKKKLKKDKSERKEQTSVQVEAVGEWQSNSQEVEAEQKAKKKKKSKDKKHKNKQTEAPEFTKKGPEPALVPAPPAPATKLTPLQASMRQKLISARFRHLNQTLYTTPSTESLSLITSNPEMFTEYHEGFRRQVEVWPENPVDGYTSTLLSRGKARNSALKGKQPGQEAFDLMPLPRTNGPCTIADLGCGDAAIATALQPHLSKLHLKIHSFDLHSNSRLITKADIANLPLADSSADIAIFCLALMGTNWIDFIEEAYRILRWKGELWVAEIKSRFGRVGGKAGSKVVEHSVGKRQKSDSKEVKKANKSKEQEIDDELAAVEVDGQPAKGEETDVGAFVEVLRKRGFVLRGEGQPGRQKEGVELGNRMFVRMWFFKAGKPTKGKGVPAVKEGEKGTWKPKAKRGFVEEEEVGNEAGVLKPCVYKLR